MKLPALSTGSRHGWTRLCLLFGAAAVWTAAAERAAALHPERPLTQALLRKWQVAQGLPRAAILSIQQGADGYVWLGTQAGLHRFDGVRFVNVLERHGAEFANLWIQDRCEDADGNVWLAADDGGLIQLHAGGASRHGPAEGVPNGRVACLLTDRRGAVWVGTSAGLARRAGERFVAIEEPDSPAAIDVRALCESADGRVWIAGDSHRLFEWDGARWRTHELQTLATSGGVTALQAAPDGALWIGTTAGLLRWQDGVEQRFSRADGLADDWVHCLLAARDGSLWVGTRDGVSRRTGAEFEAFRTRNGLSQSTVLAICEDHEGSIWVGTKHGLNQFVDRRTLPFTVSEGLPSNDAGPVLQEADGTLWVGTLDAGLARFDGRRFGSALTQSEGLPSDAVLSLARGAEGEFWIGTDHGVCRWRNGRVVQVLTTADGLPDEEVRVLCRDHRGVLWAGTEGGLAALSDGRFQPPASPLARLPIRALLDHRGATLWAATAGGGLFRQTEQGFEPVGGADADWNDVSALYEDADGLLWIGTRGAGLGLLAGDSIVRFHVKDGLHDDEIFGIVADDQDRLWMACSRGVFSVARDDLRRFARGELSRVVSTPFSPTDAQRTIECQNGVQPAAIKTADGRIWFSTIQGMIVIDPPRFERSLPPPRVVVEDVSVDGVEFSPARIGRLPPGRRNLSFRYTALTFASPTRLRFRYRLEGFDADWVDAGARREAFYTNLPQGSYRFHLAAAVGDGPWHESAHPVAFTLTPHFYQTWWFLLASAAATACAALLAMRIRMQQIRGRLQAVLAERSRIARELHDTLIQGFSGVTMQLQALAARLRSSPERQTLEEIIRDAGACLSEARRSVAGLRTPPGDMSGLSAALAQSARQLTETRELRLVLRLAPRPPALGADVEYNLLRIAQEAIANVLQHASARTLEVALECAPQAVTMLIRDDGVGCRAAEQASQPGHYGLIGMRERAAQIGATLDWESAPGRGTTVRVILPTAAASAAREAPAATAAGAPP